MVHFDVDTYHGRLTEIDHQSRSNTFSDQFADTQYKRYYVFGISNFF